MAFAIAGEQTDTTLDWRKVALTPLTLTDLLGTRLQGPIFLAWPTPCGPLATWFGKPHWPGPRRHHDLALEACSMGVVQEAGEIDVGLTAGGELPIGDVG